MSGLAETGRVECDLPILDETGSSDATSADDDYVSSVVSPLPGTCRSCRDHVVSLIIRDSPRETWTVNVFDDRSPCLIFHEDGRLIQSGDLPRAKLWFVFPSGWRFTKGLRIIEDSTPPYLAHACSIYLVDLTSSDRVVVGDGSEDEFEFRVARDKVSDPCLTDDGLVHGISIDGNPLSSESLRALRFLSDSTKAGL